MDRLELALRLWKSAVGDYVWKPGHPPLGPLTEFGPIAAHYHALVVLYGGRIQRLRQLRGQYDLAAMSLVPFWEGEAFEEGGRAEKPTVPKPDPDTAASAPCTCKGCTTDAGVTPGWESGWWSAAPGWDGWWSVAPVGDGWWSAVVF